MVLLPVSQTLIVYGDYFNQSGSLKFIFCYLLIIILELKIIADCPTSVNYLDNNARSQLHHIITISIIKSTSQPVYFQSEYEYLAYSSQVYKP